MYIPADPAEVTADALNRLFTLAGAHLPTVSAVRAIPLDGGYGYLSQSFRLELTWTGGGASDAPPTLVAKLPLRARIGEVNPSARRMFRREAMFNRHVGVDAPIRLARLFVAEFEDDAGVATMVFEDLSGLETFEDNESVSLERVQNAVTQLAALHGKYWNSDELDRMDWLAHPAVSAVDQVSTERFASMWPFLVRSGAYELSATQIRLGEMLSEKMDGVYEALHAGPQTLIHADLHQENIFFDGNEAVFIDWALAERANPAKDIAKLTASCLEPGTVAAEQPRLIRLYLQELNSRHATLRRAQDGEAPPHEGGQRPLVRTADSALIPTAGHPRTARVEGSDRSSRREREILNQVQDDESTGAFPNQSGQQAQDMVQADRPSVAIADFERDVHLATCHYLAMMTFLSDARDFDALAANVEARTDFTTSRVIAACDREEIVAAVEAL